MDIELTQDLTIGEKPVTGITVEPLTFKQLESAWLAASALPGNADVNLQRQRIQAQTSFMTAEGRVTPDLAQLGQLPVGIMTQVVGALDAGQGPAGEVMKDSGNAVTAPLMYKLGTPLRMRKGDEEIEIVELEFHAKTFSDVEVVLATVNQMTATVALIETLANPVTVPSLTRLPGMLVDKVSVPDGLTIMRQVLPNF